MDVRFSFVLVLVLVDGVCGLSECQTLQYRAIALFWHQKDFLPDHIETSKYQNVPIYAFRNSSDETICVKIYAHGSHLTFLTVILKHPVYVYPGPMMSSYRSLGISLRPRKVLKWPRTTPEWPIGWAPHPAEGCSVSPVS